MSGTYDMQDLCVTCGEQYGVHSDLSCPNGRTTFRPCTCNTFPCICVRPETLHFEGGAKRDREDIPDFRLIPHNALKRLASRYTHGRIKYGDRNWEAGDPKVWIPDCLNRASNHLSLYCSGDSSEDHLAAVAWNIFAVMFFEAKGVGDEQPS